MNGLKKIISIILLSILFNQNEKDTTNKIPIIDFSKGFNIPGIIPEEIPMFSDGLPLFPKDIEAIGILLLISASSSECQPIRSRPLRYRLIKHPLNSVLQ